MTQQTDPLTAANASRDILALGIGPTLGYHVSQCPDGGYLVLVDGKVRSACSTLVEAVAAMGRVAAGQFGETAQPPEQAQNVTPPFEPIPRGIRPVRPQQPQRAPDGPSIGAAIVERAQATAVLVLGLLAIGSRGLVGV